MVFDCLCVCIWDIVAPLYSSLGSPVPFSIPSGLKVVSDEHRGLPCAFQGIPECPRVQSSTSLFSCGKGPGAFLLVPGGLQGPFCAHYGPECFLVHLRGFLLPF